MFPDRLEIVQLIKNAIDTTFLRPIALLQSSLLSSDRSPGILRLLNALSSYSSTIDIIVNSSEIIPTLVKCIAVCGDNESSQDLFNTLSLLSQYKGGYAFLNFLEVNSIHTSSTINSSHTRDVFFSLGYCRQFLREVCRWKNQG
jgi:hypothetical protein